MTILGLVVTLVLIGLVFWVVRTLAPALQIPQPIVQVIYVVLVVMLVVWLLQQIGGLPQGPIFRIQ